MAFLAPALPYLAAAGMAAAPVVGREVGDLASTGIRKVRKKYGFKKGGTHNNKAVSKALNRATIKKTGMKLVHKNQLVIPKSVANTIKKIAKRKPQVVRRKRK